MQPSLTHKHSRRSRGTMEAEEQQEDERRRRRERGEMKQSAASAPVIFAIVVLACRVATPDESPVYHRAA